MIPEAIKAVREALNDMIALADMGYEESMRQPEENGNFAVYERAKRALVLLAAEQAKAPPDRETEEIIQRAAKEFADTAFHSFGLSQPRLDEYAGVFAELIRSVIEELRLSPVTAGEWQPIETAPQTGEFIWAYLYDTGIRTVRWMAPEECAGIEGGPASDYDGTWVEKNDREDWHPKFWLPYDALPLPPEDSPPSPKEAGR